MVKFFYIVRLTFLSKFAYIKAFWFDIAGTSISIYIYYFLWQTVFKETESIAGFTITQMTTYVVLARILASQFSGGINREIGRWIYDGTISVELLRPYFFLQTLLAKRIGEFMFFVCFKAIPIGGLYILFFKGNGAKNIISIVTFCISIILSIIIMFFLECLVGLLSFYTLSDWGLVFTKNAICALLSGGIVPLFLFPKWLAVILNYMPFAGMVSTPINLFLGKYNEKEIIYVFMTQIIWIIGLGLLLYIFYRKAIRNIVVQGG